MYNYQEYIKIIKSGLKKGTIRFFNYYILLLNPIVPFFTHIFIKNIFLGFRKGKKKNKNHKDGIY